MSSDDQLAEEVERLADEQQRTADMLESLLYVYVDMNDTDVRFGKPDWRDYWKAESPWEDH